MIVSDTTVLKSISTEVLPEEIDELRTKLEQELARSAELSSPGIGLSAIQIGIPKRMAIIRINTNAGPLYHLDIVNCQIKHAYDPAHFEGEGCLSYQGLYGKTWRYQEIYVVNNAIEPYSFIATGLPAVVIQHEMDHWDGKVLPEYIRK